MCIVNVCPTAQEGGNLCELSEPTRFVSFLAFFLLHTHTLIKQRVKGRERDTEKKTVTQKLTGFLLILVLQKCDVTAICTFAVSIFFVWIDKHKKIDFYDPKKPPL